jgi:hypothetical protein
MTIIRIGGRAAAVSFSLSNELDELYLCCNSVADETSGRSDPLYPILSHPSTLFDAEI